MDISKESFLIIFEGDAVEHGVIDVADFAPALFAFGNLCQEANKVINGDRAKIKVLVRADFEKGSFGIDLDLVMTVLEKTKALFLSSNIQNGKEILETLGVFVGLPAGTTVSFVSLFKLIKWLRGRKPEAIEPQKDGSFNISVQGDNNVINVPSGVARLYNDGSVRKNLETFAEPLKKEGFDRVGFRKDEEMVSEITKEEAPYFATYHLESEDEEFESTSTGVFEVVQPSFSSDLKWRLSDGTSRFAVTMEDEDFIKNVASHEEGFYQGDLIRCDILIRSWKTEQGLKSEKIVTKVHEVHHQPKQTSWSEDSDNN